MALRGEVRFPKTLLAVLLLVALVHPGCAHGGTRSQARAAVPAGADSADTGHDLTELNDVVLGLAGFEDRASRYSPDEWNFVLGYAHFMNGRWKEAEHYLVKVAGKFPSLEDYVLFYRAVIANRLGRHSQAIELLDSLAAGYPDSVWSEDASVERAVSLAGLRRFPEALDLLKDALDGASGDERDRVDRLIARTYIESGDLQRAAEYVKSMALATGSERDLEELRDLFGDIKRLAGVDIPRWLQSPTNQLRLAESFAADSQWSDAAHRLEGLVSSRRLDSSLEIEAKWLLARSYRWVHRYDDSIALMEELRRSPGGRRISGLGSLLATVYAKRNDYDKAIAIRKQMLASLPPNSRAAADMAYKIAFLYVDENKYAEAIPLWQQIASQRSAGRARTMARWYIGWCHFMLKDYDASLASFDELLGSGAKGARIEDRVLYWKGRALLAMRMRDEARRSFDEVVRKYPRGYYAELARRRISGESRGIADFPIARGDWGGSGIWKPDDIGSVSDMPHMRQALELDRLGLHSEVARELRACDFGARPEASEVGLWLAFKNYAHDIAYRLANKNFRGVLKHTPGRDRFAYFVWEQAYPRAYDPIVTRLDTAGDIDPMLVWSIMRNESAFRPRVISPAGAVGLMQLMPTTANLMARKLGEGKVSVSELYRPATNIAFAITYLDKLAGIFPGNAVAVIASYNAGEQAVERWLNNGKFTDIEEWIEEIPYSETNLYVKKVLNSYWLYQRLYGGQVRVAQRDVGARRAAEGSTPIGKGEGRGAEAAPNVTPPSRLGR